MSVFHSGSISANGDIVVTNEDTARDDRFTTKKADLPMYLMEIPLS